MCEYDEILFDIKNISFNKIRIIAVDKISRLSDEEKDSLWNKLRRGIALLEIDEELDYYLYAYGNMHRDKIVAALSNFTWRDFENRHIQIVDWGCGQALATICFFDFLNEKDIKCHIDKIVLIDSSKASLKRAITHVSCYGQVDEETDIVSIDKRINNIKPTQIVSDSELTIHFFSNILDIPNINLRDLARKVQGCSRLESLVICVGPNNNFNKRITLFSSFFSEKEMVYEAEHDVTNECEYTAKYSIFTINKCQKDFNFDDAITVKDFFALHGVKKGYRSFMIKTCTTVDGDQFQTLGLANGKEAEDGKPSMTFFVLSRALEERGEILNRAFIKAHKEDLLLLEPLDGLEFGIAFLSGGVEDWDVL
ncbi:MAG: hypothetical protein J6E29_01125 [Prevotella sp.]|nr:hypothetical protein [Bacteroidaceae bacterium]MBP3842224.1 hypothetical protein [Prevotella sp.]